MGEELLKRVQDLRSLKDGWDGGDSPAFSEEIIQNAMIVAGRIKTNYPDVDEAYIKVTPALGNEIHFEFMLYNSLYFIVVNPVK